MVFDFVLVKFLLICLISVSVFWVKERLEYWKKNIKNYFYRRELIVVSGLVWFLFLSL